MADLVHRLNLIHKKLETQIGDELRARFPNNPKIAYLKKLRLRVKDRLHRVAITSSIN